MAGKKDNPDVSPKPKESEFGIEIGVEQNLPFSVPFSDGLSKRAKEEKELRELTKFDGEDIGPTVSQLVAMRRLDGQARALYRLLTLPIRAALTNSTFVPADGGEAEAEFIDLQFNLPPASGGMSVTFHKFMAQLLQGLFDGFAPFEQVYDYATYGPLKGKYILRKLAYRQPNTITAVEDAEGHFAGFRQRAHAHGKSYDVYIPRDRAFYFAAQEEERKYYGVSFFQSAFYHYDKKVKMYYIAHLAAQRAAVGTRVGYYPANLSETQKRSFAQNLSNLAVAQWMMLPDSAKVEMLNDSGTFAFLDYINHHNSQMSKSILANFFDQDSGGETPMVQFGAPGDAMFLLMLQAIMDDIANSINHYIIPRLIDWNFEGGKYPTFRWAELTAEQKTLITGTFEKLASAETVSPEFTRELEKKMADQMGLEVDWEEVELREEAQQEAENLVNGLDADGKPLPKDAMGNPILPGQDNPEATLQAFEAQVAGAGAAPEEESEEGSLLDEEESEIPEDTEEVAPKKKSKKVALSVEDDLLLKAADLLELAAKPSASKQAKPTSGDYRTVRTQEGAERFGVAIGQQIPKGQGEGEQGKGGITVERLLDLKAQFEEYRRSGNDQMALKAMKALKEAVYNYTGSWAPSAFMQTMNSINPKD
jgi:hypothetical protein